MFVTIESVSQYVGEASASILLMTCVGNKSTRMEAAQCINRLVLNNDERMHEAAEEFTRLYA